MVALRLEGKAQLHPELIYYNIVQLQNLVLKRGGSKQLDLNKYTYKIENAYLTKRNDWIRDQIVHAQPSSDNYRILSTTENKMNSLVSDTVKVSAYTPEGLTFDRNLMDYFVIVYLQRDTSIRYDSTMDYTTLRRKIEHGFRKRFDAYSSMDKVEQYLQSETIIDDVLHHWYIFDDTDDEGQYSGHNAYAIIENVISNYYSSDNRSRFAVQVGYSHFGSTYSFENSHAFYYPPAEFYPSIPEIFKSNFMFETKTHAARQAKISFAYRHAIKDQIEMFSYINVEFIASLSKRSMELHQEVLRKYKIDAVVTTETFEYTFEETLLLNRIVETINGYIVKVSTPFTVLGRSLYFEIALNTGILHYGASTAYQNRLDKYVGYLISPSGPYHQSKLPMGEGSGTFENKKTVFVIYPSFDISYENDFGLKITADVGYRYTGILTGYQF